MKTLLFFFLLAGIACQEVSAQADIRLYPSRLFFYRQEGAVQQKVIHLVNRSAKRVVCRAEIVDWKRDSTGNKSYYFPGTLASSASSVMSVQYPMITLEPGEDKEVVVDMDMKLETGFKNAMLFFTQVDTDSLKRGLKILIQLGVHLYSLPERYTDKKITVRNASLLDTGNVRRLFFDISNTTQAIIDTDIKAEIRDSDGSKLDESAQLPVSSMPGDRYRVSIPFPKKTKLKNGSRIIVYLDNGMEHPLQVVEIPYQL